MQADNEGQYNITPLRAPRGPDIRTPVLIACAAILCALAGFILYKYLKYRKWIRTTLAATPEKQVYEFYMFFLRSLAACGYPRKRNETPFEYLANAETDGFPLPLAQFREATDVFAATKFGGKTAGQSARDNCFSLFASLPALVKAKKGRRFYYFSYFRKMYGRREAWQGPGAGG